MKSITIHIILLACFTINMQAQDNGFFKKFAAPKPYVALLGGYNYPIPVVNEFAYIFTSQPLPSTTGGISLTPISFGIPVITWFGFAGGVYLADDHLSETEYAQKWQNYDPNLNWKINVGGNFSMSALMLGPFLTVPFKKFSIDAELLFGRANIYVPRIDIIGANKQPDARFGTKYERLINIPSAKFNVPAICASLGFRKPLTEKFSLIGKAAYFEAETEAIEILNLPTSGYQSGYTSFSYFTFNFTLGLAYDFTKCKE